MFAGWTDTELQKMVKGYNPNPNHYVGTDPTNVLPETLTEILYLMHLVTLINIK